MKKTLIPKLLVICGPTATGKTTLALRVALLFNAALISADSRQVYRQLDIGTGKDIPAGAHWVESSVKLYGKRVGYYKIGSGTAIWGYDLVGPKENFSVAHFANFAGKIISEIYSNKQLPILVGGSGLYINSVTEGIETVSIPRNINLREALSAKNSSELFDHLSLLDPMKAAGLNFSDRKNPRRLIRAIEVAQYRLSGALKKSITFKQRDICFVGLTAPRNVLQERIVERVHQRVINGLEVEIQKLLSEKVTFNDQSMDTLGYKEWKDYFQGKRSKKETIDTWIQHEMQYAKRQLTWFRRNKNIKWYDITQEGWEKNVEKYIAAWYASANGSTKS